MEFLLNQPIIMLYYPIKMIGIGRILGMISFATRLKFFRSLRGLSQEKLANLVGISRKQVSDYEIGAGSPRKANLKKILDALGVTETEFMSSDCLFGNSDNEQQSVTAIAIILASPLRGQLINIVGKVDGSADCNEINVNIYSGTITRTKQVNKNYIDVYYLAGEREECISVDKGQIDHILKLMKTDFSQND